MILKRPSLKHINTKEQLNSSHVINLVLKQEKQSNIIAEIFEVTSNQHVLKVPVLMDCGYLLRFNEYVESISSLFTVYAQRYFSVFKYIHLLHQAVCFHEITVSFLL